MHIYDAITFFKRLSLRWRCLPITRCSWERVIISSIIIFGIHLKPLSRGLVINLSAHGMYFLIVAGQYNRWFSESPASSSNTSYKIWSSSEQARNPYIISMLSRGVTSLSLIKGSLILCIFSHNKRRFSGMKLSVFVKRWSHGDLRRPCQWTVNKAKHCSQRTKNIERDSHRRYFQCYSSSWMSRNPHCS